MVMVTTTCEGEEQTFQIHLSVLILHSPFFDTRLDGRISLPFSPDSVKLWSRWIYGLAIAPLKDYEDVPWLPLVEVWALARHCLMPKLQDHAVALMVTKLNYDCIEGVEEAVCAVWKLEADLVKEMFIDNLRFAKDLRFDRLPDGFFREAYPMLIATLSNHRYAASILEKWLRKFQPENAGKLSADVLPRLLDAPVSMDMYFTTGEQNPRKRKRETGDHGT